MSTVFQLPCTQYKISFISNFTQKWKWNNILIFILHMFPWECMHLWKFTGTFRLLYLLHFYISYPTTISLIETLVMIKSMQFHQLNTFLLKPIFIVSFRKMVQFFNLLKILKPPSLKTTSLHFRWCSYSYSPLTSRAGHRHLNIIQPLLVVPGQGYSKTHSLNTSKTNNVLISTI